MVRHLRYLRYILYHKWYVFIECCKLKIPLRGLVHDLSKFKPSQWFPYINYFYSKDSPSGKFNPRIKRRFEFACLEHQHNNPHHWQHWILWRNNGEMKVLPMPEIYRKEMLADWRGAGKAKHGYDDSKDWYLKNRDKMILHEETRNWVEKLLDV